MEGKQWNSLRDGDARAFVRAITKVLNCPLSEHLSGHRSSFACLDCVSTHHRGDHGLICGTMGSIVQMLHRDCLIYCP